MRNPVVDGFRTSTHPTAISIALQSDVIALIAFTEHLATLRLLPAHPR